MKNIGFIADLYQDELPGGGESNDDNLINFLSKENDVHCFKSNSVTIEKLDPMDCVIVGNFVLLPEQIKYYLISKKKYIIYEHDHKYVSTRDPSEFKDFVIPVENIINKQFYEASHCTVVLSEVCKSILEKTLPNVNVKNIGCSLWSEEKFKLLEELTKTEKNNKTCIMLSDNPTKNYYTAVNYCSSNNIPFDVLETQDHEKFLRSLSPYDTLVFIPKVLETFSRLCVEAKMLNLKVITKRNLIGFYSEDCSNLSGLELIQEMKNRNVQALQLFKDLV